MIIRFYNWVERQGSPHLLGERKSGRGQPQSKTLRVSRRIGRRASVLDCGCPLPLWPTRAWATLRRHTSSWGKSEAFPSQP